MQQKQTFSAQTLTLSVAAAELGRAIFGAGQTGSVRAVLLSNVLAFLRRTGEQVEGKPAGGP